MTMTLRNSLHRRLHPVDLRQIHAFRPVTHHGHRRRAPRPTVEVLEARLPLGDAVLGGIVGWWLGSSLASRESAIRASDDSFAVDGFVSNPPAESSSLERVSISSRVQPAE